MTKRANNTPASTSSNQAQIDEKIIHLYESRKKIYPREVKGIFAKIRDNGLVVLLAIYFLLPWLNWDNRQAILFDMPNRRFYIFDIVIWPQDLIILTLFLFIMAMTLFFLTALVGRVWCGYACPQTIWTEAFIWLERFAEGSRIQQIKLDKQPWNAQKIRKKVTKHALWIILALWTGLTFVGYFTAIRALIPDFFTLSASFAATFWALFYAGATYLNAGWLREQFCKTMCPYARFQGAMYDENTLLIAYDKQRGEPRRKAKRGENQDGHCIDCNLCVQVCPVGIDIRDGNQSECINCSLCIDACNDVMDQIEAPRGLIRYASDNEMMGKKTRYIRPKTIGYGVILAVGISVLIYQVITISAIELNIKRDRNILARYAPNNQIENVYSINLLNKTLDDANYEISAAGIDGLTVQGAQTGFSVKSGEVFDTTIRILADKDLLTNYNTPIELIVKNTTTGEVHRSQTRFLNVTRD
ncbi:cytochrome c oxidase accessory protein CcoG [Ostreibacterium oceani]|uniref:Cytochrome c oxidase accessory protein CcoG n=1 Tax=Ostreibacterium oceani TaxID=2654998 RepID=A0A6N7EXH4_9GAMM|nr:cytochrome c oxidase accessory protein CcoG [Ostreibacterium oceani]MPV86089.1 cytochrome c oxidase accessory protein CcoG [Ostreibacterium oceani]